MREETDANSTTTGFRWGCEKSTSLRHKDHKWRVCEFEVEIGEWYITNGIAISGAWDGCSVDGVDGGGSDAGIWSSC